MSTSLSESIRDQHERFLEVFGEYRDKLTEVLFYGERISRSELTEGKDRVIGSLKTYADVLRKVLLPAVTDTETEHPVSGVELFADFLDRLLMFAEGTEGNIEFFANPDAPKEDRNDAAREVLKDLYRLDSVLSVTFNLLEEHLLEEADEELTEDERAELLSPLADIQNEL
jgi:hypothetical protein